MESSTKILRRLLDERGVEHEDIVDATLWKGVDGTAYTAAEVYTRGNTKPSTKKLVIRHMATPEQAIAATLGATDAKPTQVESSGTCEADETDTWECVRDDFGGYGKTLTVHVMECIECGHVYEHVNGDYEYCPRCGRKREDVSE